MTYQTRKEEMVISSSHVDISDMVNDDCLGSVGIAVKYDILS